MADYALAEEAMTSGNTKFTPTTRGPRPEKPFTTIPLPDAHPGYASRLKTMLNRTSLCRLLTQFSVRSFCLLNDDISQANIS